MLVKFTSGSRRDAGFTLPELLIGVAISGVVLTQVCLIWFYSSRSFAAQMSYVDMDQLSQRALDVLTREIRQVKALTSYAPNQLVFRDFDDQPLTFRFEGAHLIRIKTIAAVERKTVLLKDCRSGGFSIYQRNPVQGSYDYYPTGSPATCKLVEVRWMCARRLFPSAPETRESMQSAKIVIRSNGA